MARWPFSEGVQPVDRPERADVDLGLRGQVDADPAVRRVDLVVHRVQYADASHYRSTEQLRQAAHLAVVVESGGQQNGTVGGELAGAMEQVFAKPVGVPRRPQCVVETDRERGHLGSVGERSPSWLRRTSAAVAPGIARLQKETSWSSPIASARMRAQPRQLSLTKSPKPWVAESPNAAKRT
jgi:hypothetical protein